MQGKLNSWGGQIMFVHEKHIILLKGILQNIKNKVQQDTIWIRIGSGQGPGTIAMASILYTNTFNLGQPDPGKCQTHIGNQIRGGTAGAHSQKADQTLM